MVEHSGAPPVHQLGHTNVGAMRIPRRVLGWTYRYVVPNAEVKEPMPAWVPRAMLLFFGGVLGLLAVLWLLDHLRGLLVLILVSLFLSFAIEPAVNRLERIGFRRSLGTLLVFISIIAGVTLFTWAIGSALADQVDTFVEEAPGYIEDVEEWADDTLGIQLDTDQLVEEFQEGGSATRLATRLAGDLVGLGTRVLGIILQVFTVGLFTFYLVVDGPRLRRAICSVLPPDRQRTVLRIWELAIEKTGGYIYSRTLLAIASTIVHWAAFAVIDVPFPLPLALWVGVMSQFIPVVGTYLAGALPIVITLLDAPRSAIWVLLVVVVYQQIENYLIAPPVTAHTMELHPAIAFGSVIAGASILGAVGALLALPVSATLQAFVSSSLSYHEVVESDLTRQDHR